MALHTLAGKQAPLEFLTDIPALVTSYFVDGPDVSQAAQLVSFGTSGHRGVSTRGSFNEKHIIAITQAVCEYRKKAGIDGPLFIGADTHALSTPALVTAIEVLAANQAEVRYAANLRPIPTPGISHAIINYNKGRSANLADGIVITPSHNPPDAGGFKYNPPHGGPADTDVTKVVQDQANELLRTDCKGIERVDFKKALAQSNFKEYDFVNTYVADLANVVDMDALSAGKVKIGVDPMGGASIDYWEPIADRYKLDLEVVNRSTDPAFAFMTLDHDGKIRMDCSSPYAMASLISLKDRFDIAFGNDPDSDRHGIVTPSGLMNPNHYLAVAIGYLYNHRPQWPTDAAVGKTLVSSGMIDRLVKDMGRTLCEVPVGFKWFVPGLSDGSIGFGGEESAGASFLRKDGTVWTTDKDGIILDLLAAEMTVVTGKNPQEHYNDLTQKFGSPVYERKDVAATPKQKSVLSKLSPSQVTADSLAGDPIEAKLTEAPGNNASIGGLKVISENGWFAARPSGTEDIYKVYAESFVDETHLRKIQGEAEQIVSDALS